MRVVLASILMVISSFSYSEDCEPILYKLVEKLTQQGKLARDENIYLKKFSATEFMSSCRVQYKNTEYVLYLHPDEVSIVVSFIDPGSGYKTFKGPFYSAYRK